MAITNIAQGGNKYIKVLGIKEMQKRIREIMDEATGNEIAAEMGGIAAQIEARVEANARAVNIPSRALDDLYTYSRQPDAALRRNSVTALAGLRKKGRKGARGYVVWSASSQASAGRDKTNRGRRRRDRLKLNVRGTQIGENLATMWEFGTSKMPARPFFRPAIASARPEVLGWIAAAYKKFLDRKSA